MKHMKSILAAVIAAVTFSGCAGMSDRDARVLTGVGIGAAAGSVLSGGDAGATVGGAIVGGVIANETDRRTERQRNFDARQREIDRRYRECMRQYGNDRYCRNNTRNW